MKTEIRCQYAMWNDEIQLAVFTTEEDGKQLVASPLTLVEYRRGTFLTNPTMTMRKTEAQQLIDELWRCGLRPSEGTGSAGSLKATENHLDDMRRIAFAVLEIDGAEAKPAR